ncbi:M1 family aminopeptidase [Aquisalimonas sp.]|uniref:M1 family metallopeptidase n=1 Tax=Aquisalimonas sp. TaxID=1872621 RepID=UPI0025BE589D|nr:M1 family aminopeptidase [Aquisalimonas sp.]
MHDATATLFALFLAGLSVTDALSAGEQPAPPHKHLEVTLKPADRHLEARLELRPATSARGFQLAEGLEVKGVRAGGQRLSVRDKGGGRWAVRVPEAAESVIIEYAGRIAGREEGGRRGQFLGPDGSYLDSAGAWYPRIEGVSRFAWTLEVALPPGQRAVASGGLVEESLQEARVVARYRHPRARGITLAAGPWRARSAETADGVVVRTLFPEALDGEYADTYLARTVDHLERFNGEIGPYPLESYQVAASPLPVGLAFAGFTWLGERVIPLPFIPETSLAHEVLHAWWGNGVYVDHERGNWSEGLTTYMADYRLDVERGRGRETRERWLRDYALLPADADRSLRAFRSGNRGADRVVGYHRGAMLFLMLEERIGEGAFREAVAALWDRHRHRTAAWEDLAAAFSHAAGEDLGPFFTQWLERTGAPELAVDDVAVDEREDGGWSVTGEVRQIHNGEPFALRVPVVVKDEADDSVTQWLELEDRATAFTIDTEARPRTLAVDPQYRAFRRLPAMTVPALLRAVELDPATRVVPLVAQAKEIATSALGREVQPVDPGTRPAAALLVVGDTDQVKAWLEHHGLEAPESVREAGAARAFAIPETRITVLSADRGEHLRGLAGVLRHDGHRSYVIRDRSGQTLDRGTWATAESPLRVDLQADP